MWKGGRKSLLSSLELKLCISGPIGAGDYGDWDLEKMCAGRTRRYRKKDCPTISSKTFACLFSVFTHKPISRSFFLIPAIGLCCVLVEWDSQTRLFSFFT